jgi:hypothetical protein
MKRVNPYFEEREVNEINLVYLFNSSTERSKDLNFLSRKEKFCS